MSLITANPFWAIVKGLGNNLIFTLLSCIIPFVCGAFFLYAIKKEQTKLLSWGAVLFEALCPVVLLTYMCYSSNVPTFFAVVIAFSICFVGYIPARAQESYSQLKNLLYYGLGLFRSVFLWSFCVSIIGGIDLLKATMMVANTRYEFGILLLPLAVSFAILAVVSIARKAIKDSMK